MKYVKSVCEHCPNFVQKESRCRATGNDRVDQYEVKTCTAMPDMAIAESSQSVSERIRSAVVDHVDWRYWFARFFALLILAAGCIAVLGLFAVLAIIAAKW